MLDIFIFTIILILAGVNYIYFFQLAGYSAQKYIKSPRGENLSAVFLGIAFFAVSMIFEFHLPLMCRIICNYIFGFSLLAMNAYFFLKKRKIKLKYTPRVVRLLITMAILIILIFLPFAITKTVFYPIFAAVSIAIPLIMLMANIINSPIEYLLRKKYIKEAVKKLDRVNPMVVAVTGSYGKTSVKNIINDILGATLKTYCSPHSFNTPMGMCRAVKEMPEDTKVFIAEFGARKKGDVAELCEMMRPILGVIVGINNQHIETFGSLDKTAKAKCELTEYLAEKNCTTIVGTEGRNAELLISSVKSKMICVTSSLEGVARAEKFILKYGKTVKGYFVADNCISDEHGSLFNISQMDDRKKLTDEIPHLRSKLIGDHNAFNITLGVAVAKQFGLSKDEIIRGVVNTKGVPHRLEVINSGGLVIIDDTYNSNEDGFRCALKTLADYNNIGNKILVTAGIVELGAEQYKTNYNLCPHIFESADEVIIVGQTNKQAFSDGLTSVNYPTQHMYFVKTLDEAQQLFATILKRGDCLLMENDLPDNYK